ncbi:MAG: transglutaminase-like domain-containing protein [Planctomycetes bacterium]|nr:transglutaminase-like domain-containing protein [Planctomycetota bacterium]
MNLATRPLLLPALALWGWQADLLPAALAMGLLLELHRVLPLRLELRAADFERLWNVTAVAFLGVVFYLAFSRQGLDGVGALVGEAAADEAGQGRSGMHRVSDTALTFLRWLPFIIYPFTLAHAWSRLGALPWSAFSLYEQARAKRRPDAPRPPWADWPLHPGFLYLATALFASTTATTHSDLYLPLALAVLLLALLPVRTRGHRPLAWLLTLVLLGAVSVWARQGHLATRDAWMEMEQRLIATAMGIGTGGGGGGQANQQRSVTAMGAVGALKQSGAIILRVDNGAGEAPGLLREAAFERYHAGVWDAVQRPWAPLAAQPATAAARRMTVARYTANGAAPLAVPGDLLRVSTPPPAGIEATGLGAVRVHAAPPIALYELDAGPGGGLDDPPGPDDRQPGRLAEDEREAIAATVAELGLAGLPPAQAAERLEGWFAAGFTYSLRQDPRPGGVSPLAWFLRQTRSGHCEFYATATVLLLRAAGIPARYAVGFSVSERQDGQWLARGRDAHAWCLAWIDGAWRDVDTTPGTWRAHESTALPWWQGLSDRWEQARYRFALWRQSGSGWRLVVFAVGMAVLAWIAWRQLRGGRWRQAFGGRHPAAAVPGAESAFAAVLARLAALHGPRPPHLTPRAWLAQLPAALPAATLEEALRLHQRLRFDPAGLDAGGQERLRTLAQELLRALAASRRGLRD